MAKPLKSSQWYGLCFGDPLMYFRLDGEQGSTDVLLAMFNFFAVMTLRLLFCLFVSAFQNDFFLVHSLSTLLSAPFKVATGSTCRLHLFEPTTRVGGLLDSDMATGVQHAE
jgi:hypothetical protein